MKTMEPEAPTSHTSARCRAVTAGALAAVVVYPPAVAAYAITHSRYATKHNSLSSPGLAGRSSIPETAVLMREASGMLDARPSRGMTAETSSIRVLVPGQKRDRRLREDHEIEQHRPVLDVVEIEFHALLDLLFIVDLAAPAVDLRPAGDPRLDAMAREITVDGFVEQARLQLALHRMRPRAD